MLSAFYLLSEIIFNTIYKILNICDSRANNLPFACMCIVMTVYITANLGNIFSHLQIFLHTIMTSLLLICRIISLSSLLLFVCLCCRFALACLQIIFIASAELPKSFNMNNQIKLNANNTIEYFLRTGRKADSHYF